MWVNLNLGKFTWFLEYSNALPVTLRVGNFLTKRNCKFPCPEVGNFQYKYINRIAHNMCLCARLVQFKVKWITVKKFLMQECPLFARTTFTGLKEMYFEKISRRQFGPDYNFRPYFFKYFLALSSHLHSYFSWFFQRNFIFWILITHYFQILSCMFKVQILPRMFKAPFLVGLYFYARYLYVIVLKLK